MKSIHEYDNWLSTVQNLHQAAKLLGVLRIVRLPHQPNYLEMGLKVTPEGVSTDVLPGGVEVFLNFADSTYSIRQNGKSDATLSLTGKEIRSVLGDLVNALRTTELAEVLQNSDESNAVEQFIAAATKAGHDLSNPENKLSDTPLQFEAEVGRVYADALYSVFTGIARFRARLTGNMTPLVIWPGHFDLSGLWFATEEADENAPHLNFGWSPYGGGIEEPYLYAYAYPMRTQDVSQLPKPIAPAYWHTEGWKGVVVLHRELANGDVATVTEKLCLEIFPLLRSVLPNGE